MTLEVEAEDLCPDPLVASPRARSPPKNREKATDTTRPLSGSVQADLLKDTERFSPERSRNHSTTFWGDDGRSTWKPSPKQLPHRSPPRQKLGPYERLLARGLAGLQRSVAREVITLADELREQFEIAEADRAVTRSRTGQAAEKEARKEAIGILKECQTYAPEQAEAVVRRRVGMTREHPLHTYGGLLHLALYPVTIFLAVLAYCRVVCYGCSLAGRTSSKTLCVLQTASSACALVAAMPLVFFLVIFFAPADLAVLLLRPVLSGHVKRRCVCWQYPSSLAFWMAGVCGFGPAVCAHHLLGAAPSAGGVLFTFGGRAIPHPPLAFRAAVYCDPHFMAEPHYLRVSSLKGVPEEYTPPFLYAGAAMPLTVQWAYLLGDLSLCGAWEAEMEKLRPPNQKSALPARGPAQV